VEQEAPRGVCVLCKGRVKLSMTSSEGKTVILRLVQPLGLHAAVSGQPYQASAETLEPCQLNFIRRDDFLPFLSSHADTSLRAALSNITAYASQIQQVSVFRDVHHIGWAAGPWGTQHLSGSYQAACEQIARSASLIRPVRN
jgi:CRP-like cAMP-binding protein